MKSTPLPILEDIGASAIIINMDAAVERMQEMTRQLDVMGIKYQRVPATTPDTLCHGLTDPYWTTGIQPMSATEKALFESHWRCWKMVAEWDRPMIVFEDDAILSQNLKTAWQRWSKRSDLDFIDLETWFGRKLIGPKLDDGLYQLHESDLGSAAYILSPTGAQKLLAMAEKFSGLVDVYLMQALALKKAQADPALALQAIFAQQIGINTAINELSTNHRATPTELPHLTQRVVMHLRRLVHKYGRMVRKRLGPRGSVRKVVQFDNQNQV